MTRMMLRIILQSPVLLAASPPASNLTESLSFIPGNTIRGMVARRYLDQGGGADAPLFRSLFLDGDVRFGFARVHNSVPVPLSARSCKYAGGFMKEDNENHSVIDLLLSPRDEEKECDRCQQPIDYFHGFYDPVQFREVAVRKHLITRTAIDAYRGAARTGQLFSQRVLSEGQEFFAEIEASENVASQIARLLAEPFLARMGTGTSRGQGWVEVSIVDRASWNWGTASARFPQFLYREEKADENCRSALAVTLLSDGLFHDAYLRDTTAPTLQDLSSLGINGNDWEPQFVRAFMDTRVVFGFDGPPVLLPRQPRLAIVAGSTFLFVAKEGCSAPQIPEGDGVGWIGDRSLEGYGRAILWHPFHSVQKEAQT